MWKNIRAGCRWEVRHRSEAEHIRHERLLCIFDKKCVGGGPHKHRSKTHECEVEITQIRREWGQANTIGKGETMEEKE